MSALGFHVSSRTMTLDSAGYSYFSLVSQHTLPTQAYAADALAAEKANITVAVPAAKTYLLSFMFTPLVAPRMQRACTTYVPYLPVSGQQQIAFLSAISARLREVGGIKDTLRGN